MAHSILVLDSDARRSAALCAALAPLDGICFETRLQLLSALASDDPTFTAAALLVAPAEEARQLVRDLDRLRPSLRRAFVCDPHSADDFGTLARLSTEGHLLTMLEGSVGDQAATIRSLVEPRESRRLSVALVTRVTFDLDDQTLVATLSDVSTSGVGISLPLHDMDQLGQLRPGTHLTKLRLHHGHVLLLEASKAVVRRQEVLAGDPPRVHLGLELQAPTGSGEEMARIEQPHRLAALLRRAMRNRSVLWVRRTRANEGTWEIAEAQLELRRDRRLLRGVVGGAIVPGEVLELNFEFAGRGYFGEVSVLSSGPEATFSLPTTLRQAHRRRALRQRATASPVTVGLFSPLTSQPILRSALDHSGTGLSLLIDGSSEALPPGLLLGTVSLTLSNGRRHECRGQVRYIEPLKSFPGSGLKQPHRIGLRLMDVSESLRAELLEAKSAGVEPAIKSSDEVPYASVWKLFHEAGRAFDIYPPEPQGPHLETLENAQRCLRRAQGALGKSFVSQSQAVDAYAMGLRLYSRTWQTQHLTVRPRFDRGDNVSGRLSAAVVEYGEAQPDIEYMRYVWFDNVRWTARFSLFIARQLETRGLTHLCRLSSMLLPADRTSTPILEVGMVHEANLADRAEIERLLLQRGEQVRLIADDWRADEMDLRSLRARSDPYGIQRKRTIFVCRDQGQLRAFAFAEAATPGLELHEFTNAFRVFNGVSRGGQDNVLARAALVARCVHHYRRSGQAYVVGLVSPDDKPLLSSMGFLDRGDLTEWTFHKSLVRAWQELASAQAERMRRENTPATIGQFVERTGQAA